MQRIVSATLAFKKVVAPNRPGKPTCLYGSHADFLQQPAKLEIAEADSGKRVWHQLWEQRKHHPYWGNFSLPEVTIMP
eukprot:1160808-Pelagomonas_calceolata.AAC.31